MIRLTSLPKRSSMVSLVTSVSSTTSWRRPAGDGDDVESQLREDRRDFERMGQVGLARATDLAAVRLRREDVRPSEQVEVGVRLVRVDPVAYRLEADHRRPVSVHSGRRSRRATRRSTGDRNRTSGEWSGIRFRRPGRADGGRGFCLVRAARDAAPPGGIAGGGSLGVPGFWMPASRSVDPGRYGVGVVGPRGRAVPVGEVPRRWSGRGAAPARAESPVGPAFGGRGVPAGGRGCESEAVGRFG